jgi:hypothetical protein
VRRRYRAGVAFDPAADAVRIKVEGGELDVGCEDFPEPPDIKRKRGLARQAGAALAVMPEDI